MVNSKGKMSEPCISPFTSIEVDTHELAKVDVLVYADQIKNFSSICSLMMLFVIFASSAEADKFVDIHESRMG